MKYRLSTAAFYNIIDDHTSCYVNLKSIQSLKIFDSHRAHNINSVHLSMYTAVIRIYETAITAKYVCAYTWCAVLTIKRFGACTIFAQTMSAVYSHGKREFLPISRHTAGSANWLKNHCRHSLSIHLSSTPRSPESTVGKTRAKKKTQNEHAEKFPPNATKCVLVYLVVQPILNKLIKCVYSIRGAQLFTL